jgi:NAD(P)-dependent dehydrogenase (short-subunit alcohol dehydrogenase family)
MGILEGKVAAVTGAGRGIGRGIAVHLAREGASVVVNDLGGSVHGEGSDTSVAEEVVEEIKASGGKAVANTDSVASWGGGQRIIQTALATFGRIDILVNNAGILRDQFIWDMSEQEWDAVINVHLHGSFHCTRAAVPHMQRQQWGRIIFITSTAGFIGTIAQSNYGAAKMGMLGLSRTVALEMYPYHVTSNCIAPFAWTRIPASIPVVTEEIGKSVDRLFKTMRPEDISPLAVFLASDQAHGITGQVFGVRGKEIYTFNQPRVVRSIHSAEGWTPEDLIDVIEPALTPHFTPLDNSITYFSWEALV